MTDFSLLQIATPEDGREIFLFKYKDILRNDVDEHLKKFKSFNIGNNPQGMLSADETLMLFESRGEPKTVRELKSLFPDAEKDKTFRINFLEFLCVIYSKSYSDVTNFQDDEAREEYLNLARSAGESAEKLQKELEALKLEKEMEEKRLAEEIEAESKMTGVAAKGAFFRRQISNVADSTQTNEQLIKQEAAKRKALKEAKQKEKDALDQLKAQELQAVEVQKEIQQAQIRAAEEEAVATAAKLAEEKSERAARKAALNAKWAVGGTA